MRMKFRRSIAAWLAGAFIVFTAWGWAPPDTYAAADPIQLFLNGRLLASEVSPRLVEDTTVVPVRIIAEELGAKVEWEAATRRVTVKHDGVNIDLGIGQADAMVNGSAAKLPVAPMIVEGSTLLPVRFVGESLGVKVSWDGLNRSVYLSKVPPTGGGDGPSGSGSNGSPPASPPSGVTSGGDAASGTAGSPATTPTQPAPTPPSPPTTVASPAAPPAAGPTQQPPATGTSPAETTGAPALTRIEAAENRLKIFTGGTVTPTLFYLDNPSRLVIDLPGVGLGATVNGVQAAQNGEAAVVHPMIGKIRYALFSSDPPKARIVIDLKEPAVATLSDSPAPGWIEMTLQPGGQKPAPSSKNKYIVVIDPGHGAKDVGATSVKKRYEKDFNLSLANKVYVLLKQNPRLEPVLTRSDDTFVELSDRANLANGMGADLFLSIHGNSYKTDIRGTETYYSRPESLEFANVVHRHALEGTGFPDRSVRKSGFKVTRETVMPGVLLEVGYLSNKDDEAEMYKEAFQQRLAESLAAAIKEYLHIETRE